MLLFPSIVWVGSKNRKDGGKHAQTELLTQAANRQNILEQTYFCYFYYDALQADLNCLF